MADVITCSIAVTVTVAVYWNILMRNIRAGKGELYAFVADDKG